MKINRQDTQYLCHTCGSVIGHRSEVHVPAHSRADGLAVKSLTEPDIVRMSGVHCSA